MNEIAIYIYKPSVAYISCFLGILKRKKKTCATFKFKIKTVTLENPKCFFLCLFKAFFKAEIS